MCIHLYLDVVRQTYKHADRQLVYINRRQVEIQIEKLKEKISEGGKWPAHRQSAEHNIIHHVSADQLSERESAEFLIRKESNKKFKCKTFDRCNYMYIYIYIGAPNARAPAIWPECPPL